MKAYCRLWLLLALLGSVSNAAAQTKYEREYRLRNTEALPAPAVAFLDTAADRIRWYYEENLLGNSIEAKFRLNGRRYSVEFDTLGHLQDIEVETELSDLLAITRETIHAYLQDTYQKYRIRKVQVQYSGRISSLAVFRQFTDPSDAYRTRYELVVKGRNATGWQLYELTFDQTGEHLQTDQIILRNTDNLEY
jgi:hypothetical protein